MKSLTRSFGQLVLAYPETTITSMSFLGLILGVTLWSIAGWCIGSLMSHPLTGMYCGLGWYAFSYAYSADQINADLDARIAYVKRLTSVK